jgi:hypothetical protein
MLNFGLEWQQFSVIRLKIIGLWPGGTGMSGEQAAD